MKVFQCSKWNGKGGGELQYIFKKVLEDLVNGYIRKKRNQKLLVVFLNLEKRKMMVPPKNWEVEKKAGLH